MSSLRIVEGGLVRTGVSFRDVDDVLADPATTRIHWMTPAGTSTVYTYAVDVEVIRDSLGVYHMDRIPDSTGKWWVRWEGVGLVSADGSFLVVEGQFP